MQINSCGPTKYSILKHGSVAKGLFNAFYFLIIFSIIFNLSFVNGQNQENTLKVNWIQPDQSKQGVTVQAVVSGSGFTQETKIYLKRGTFTVNPIITRVRGTLLESALDITFDLPVNPDLLGAYDLTVWNPNGEEYTLQNAFFAVVGQFEERLTVTSVNPQTVERGNQTWLELNGTGFVYVADGSTVNGDWESGHPFSTLIIPPQGISVVEMQVTSSSYMRILLQVDFNFPPQDVVNFKIFNPRINGLSLDYSAPDLWEDQHDQNQLSGFSLAVINESPSSTIPEFPSLLVLPLLVVLLLVSMVLKRRIVSNPTNHH
jgi:hypothetical protein